jgi:hypothetical protein
VLPRSLIQQLQRADALRNVVHAALSPADAEFEVKSYFPEGWEQLDRLKAMAEVCPTCSYCVAGTAPHDLADNTRH